MVLGPAKGGKTSYSGLVSNVATTHAFVFQNTVVEEVNGAAFVRTPSRGDVPLPVKPVPVSANHTNSASWANVTSSRI
jgi:hypothetical protein